MSENFANKVQVDSELKKRLAGLYQSMAKRLGIKTPPKIIFSHDAANAEEPFGKTAYYDPASKTIRVYITKRHPTDILRSFAHELIHHWQNEHNALPQSNAGQAHYAQNDPVLRKREMEAYLLGNILFRDWQDENRYGKLNENLEISDPTRVQKAIRQTLFNLIKSNAIRSYHRKTTSGDMNPVDYIDEISRKLELELNKFLQVVNNRGNWENQQNMISEWTREQLKEIIFDRIVEAKKKKSKFSKKWDEFKQDREKYEKWLKTHLTSSDYAKEQEKKHKEKEKYYFIGFTTPHVCWYWDKKKIVTANGGSHMEHFGRDIPYQNFRGRYDILTKELSLAVPQYGYDALHITGKLEKDVPPELLRALEKTFPGHKLFYFPSIV